jgi:hypothetical protein
MSLTFSNLATASSTTLSTNLQVQVTASVGEYLLVCIAADNAGTAGVASLQDTLLDDAGNTYTLLSKINNSPFSENSGTTLGIWLGKLTSALSSSNITATFSTSTRSKAITVKKIVPSLGKTVGVYSIGPGYTGSDTVFTTETVLVPFDYTIFGVTAAEHNQAINADTDTTSGAWSTAYSSVASTGTANTSQSISSQQKTVTTLSNQIYNTSVGLFDRDYAINYVIFFPDDLPPGFIGYWSINGVTCK